LPECGISTERSRVARERRKIGDLLLSAGVLTASQLEEALQEQKTTGELVGQVLVRRGWTTEQVICEILHQQLGLPVVQLEGLELEEHVLSMVSEELASKYLALPLSIEGQRGGRSSALLIAMADPLNVAAIEDLRFHSGHFIRPVLAPASQIATSQKSRCTSNPIALPTNLLTTTSSRR